MSIDKFDEDNQQPDDDGKTTELDNIALYNRLKDYFEFDYEHSQEWRAKAKGWFGFVSGDQWDKLDRSYLEEQKRPIITFNRVISIIKAVAGIEINGRHETVYLPRGTNPGQVRANEILTGASQWMADGCDAEDEQSSAFQDSLVCGMGWTEATIEYEEEPDGKYIEKKIDPLEMYWDRSARAKNLSDARRVFRVRKMTLGEARDMFPGVPDFELDAPWAIGAENQRDPKPIEERRLKLENSTGPSPKSDVHIVHVQWYEKVPYFRVTDPETGEIKEVDEDAHKQVQELAGQAGIKITSVRQMKRVYKQAFLGGAILGEVQDAPCPDRFSWACITGELDRNKGTFYGLVALMEDPQKWANKWLSQTLHILNTTAKGGIIAESDAFKDQRAAQDTYAQPDAITWAAKGAISQGKIMQKPGVGIPTAYVNLLEFAIASIRDVTGINLELLGMRDANQPGILEHQRKQAAMTILATAFDSLRRFRKQIGRVRLHYIQSYLSDGRLIRITGKEGQELVPLLRDQTMGDYEVIVEDAPTSPNQKEATWATIQQVLPAFRELLTPDAVITILEYSPLPSKLVAAFKEMSHAPNPEAEKAKAITEAMAKIKIEREAAAKDKDIATAEATRAGTLIELATAGVQAAQLGLIPATQNVMSPEPWTMATINDPFAIDPQGAMGGMIPKMMPQVPQVPQQAGLPMPPMAPGEAEQMALPGLPPMLNGR